jgi:hypothetical protein
MIGGVGKTSMCSRDSKSVSLDILQYLKSEPPGIEAPGTTFEPNGSPMLLLSLL